MSNVLIEILAGGQVVASQMDTLGFYRFEGGLEGSYEIRFTEMSGLFAPLTLPFTLGCASPEVVLDANLMEMESVALAAQAWVEDSAGGKGPANPPANIQEEVLVYYIAHRDSGQAVDDPALNSLHDTVFPNASTADTQLDELQTASLAPSASFDNTYEQPPAAARRTSGGSFC